MLDEGTMKEYYKLKTTYCNYYAEVWHQYPNIDKVYVGGKRKCVAFTVYLDEPTPNLDAIGFHEGCNTRGDLSKGHGTRHMVMTAFAFLKLMYRSHINGLVLLRDASVIDCYGYDMPLSHYYMLHYGKTWYQKHFHAQPSLSKWRNKLSADVITWSALLQSKPVGIFNRVAKKEKRKMLDDMYATCKTLQEFLHKLKSMDCNVYKDWADILVRDHMPYLIGMEWNIDMRSLDLPSIHIEEKGTIKPKDLFIMGGAVGVFSSPPP